MTDARFSKQDIDNQGADRLFDGFPMREIVGYDSENGKLRRIRVGSDGSLTDSSNTTLLDFDGGSNPIYIGKATPGAATSASAWQIKKLTYDGSDNLVSIEHAGGTNGFTQIWDDRASLSYS